GHAVEEGGGSPVLPLHVRAFGLIRGSRAVVEDLDVVRAARGHRGRRPARVVPDAGSATVADGGTSTPTTAPGGLPTAARGLAPPVGRAATTRRLPLTGRAAAPTRGIPAPVARVLHLDLDVRTTTI